MSSPPASRAHLACQRRAGRAQRCYGVRSRRTRLLEDQLGRADAGSWQRRRCHPEGGCRWHLRRRFPSSLRRRALADPPTLRIS
eukprot:scaffold21174_cov52-Phaeocystis_antarctica.AAC.2